MAAPRALMMRLLVVLLIAGGALLGYSMHIDDGKAPSTETTAADTPVLGTPGSRPSPVSPQIGATAAADLPLRLAVAAPPTGPAEQAPPLPPAQPGDLPTNDDWSQAAIERLIVLSDAGDPQAAVLLLRRHQRCAAYEGAWRRAAGHQRELEQSTDPQRREALSALIVKEGERLQSDERCKVLPPWSATTLFDLQWRAATLGDRQAILEAVLNPALTQVSPLQHADRFDRYQQQAPGLLQDLLRRGDLDAVRLLAEVHADPSSSRWLGQLVAQDDRIALTYAQLYLEAGGRRYRDRLTRQSGELAARLSPADAAAALTRAQDLSERYFGPGVARNEMGYGARGGAERNGWFQGKPLGGD